MALVLPSGAALWAHGFWPVPSAFVVTPGAVLEVREQTGSRFPTRAAALAPDRVADARIVDAPGSAPIRNLWVARAPLLTREPLQTPGQRIVAVTLRPRAVSDSAAVADAVDRFHAALATADTAAALALLAHDAVVLESGGAETREEYRSHHLPSDVAFARAVRRERSPIRVRVEGDVAWATSTSTAVGEFRGRAVNSHGAELMVLRRGPEGWRIVAIHWSSRARRP